MILQNNGKTIEVEKNFSMYLFLNGKLMEESDTTYPILQAKQNIINTLIALELPYKIEQNLWEDEEGCMHEVREITTIE